MDPYVLANSGSGWSAQSAAVQRARVRRRDFSIIPTEGRHSRADTVLFTIQFELGRRTSPPPGGAGPSTASCNHKTCDDRGSNRHPVHYDIRVQRRYSPTKMVTRTVQARVYADNANAWEWTNMLGNTATSEVRACGKTLHGAPTRASARLDSVTVAEP